jgi:hypothetical protein
MGITGTHNSTGGLTMNTWIDVACTHCDSKVSVIEQLYWLIGYATCQECDNTTKYLREGLSWDTE